MSHSGLELMLGLYLDTLIIGHILHYVEYIKWINIANGVAQFQDKNILCVLHQKCKTQQQKSKHNNPEPEIEIGTSRTAIWRV